MKINSELIKLERNKYYELNTKEIIDDFLENILFRFFDSVLKECHYVSGSSRDHETNSLECTDSIARLTMIFESQINKGFTIELCFEHIVRFNLVPSPEGYDSLWGDSDIYIDNDYIIFRAYRDSYSDIELNDMTWVKAKSLKLMIR